MRRFAMVIGATLAATAGAQAATRPPAAELRWVRVDFPDRDHARLELRAAPIPDAPRAFASHRLMLGGLEIPVAAAGETVTADGKTIVPLMVELCKVPEGVLDLPLDEVPLRWEGSNAGRERAAIAGVLSTSRRILEVSEASLEESFGKVTNFVVNPSMAGLSVRALASCYNPFGFDIVAKRLAYRVVVGDQPIFEGVRAGFRLRAGERSDVLLEQDIPLAQAAGGLAAVMRGEPARLDATITIRTPKGERAIPLGRR